MKAVKSEPVDAPSHIEVVLANQRGAEVRFKIKPTTRLSKLFEAYCNRQSVAPSALRFLLDGERLSGESTAADVGLSDLSVIDVVHMQTGGGSE